MSSYENSSLTEIEAVLDGLADATSLEVFDATRPYSPRALAAVAASRADAAGEGGSGGLELLGPYAVTYQTPGLTDPADNGALVGPEIAVGSVVISGWFAVTTEWTVAAGSVDASLVTLDPSGLAVAQRLSHSPASVVTNVPGSGDNPYQLFIRTQAQRLAVAVYSDTGSQTFTAGAADIYALVYSPA